MHLEVNILSENLFFLLQCYHAWIKTFPKFTPFHKKEKIWQKQGKTMWNWSKKAKYGLKIKEKALFNTWKFNKMRSSAERRTLTPLTRSLKTLTTTALWWDGKSHIFIYLFFFPFHDWNYYFACFNNFVAVNYVFSGLEKKILWNIFIGCIHGKSNGLT